MQDTRRRIWNWLPAFLEVADSGSMATAAKRLHLTPAAVSRTIRLLESDLGEPLFNRVGRTLVLNSRGAELRNAMHTAVAHVDDGLLRSLGDPFVGTLRVASIGLLTHYFVIPELISLRREYPSLLPENQNLGTADATTLLVRGEIDVAFYYEDLTVEGLVVEHLGQTGMSVYCGRGHPLFSIENPSEDEILQHPFSVSAPASRAGLAVLMHEQAEKKPKLYLYVPDLKRTRTVTGKQVATSMMGTDFSYEEFSYLQNVAEDNTTTRVDDEDLDGNPSYVFDTKPGDPEAAYSLIRTYVDQTMCVPVLTRFYKGETVAKELVVDRSSIQEIGGRQVPHKVVMHDRTQNTRTELTAKDVQIEPDLDDSMFHPKRLGMSL